MSVISRRFWQSDHYDWLSGYLAARKMSGPTRAVMAFLSSSFVAGLIVLLTSQDGPREPVTVAMAWIAVIGGLAGMALFAWRWPTRAQSLAFVVVVNTSIALACLAHPNPLAALIGCIAFATSGAYVAFFHSTGWMLYNFGVATIVVTVQAVRVAMTGHPALAWVDWWLIVEVNVALPLGGQILVRALAGDLLRADTDPLTGLLNRRAFHRKALGMIHTRPSNANYLMVMLIDLDNFKALNDTYGHKAGDQALVHAARTLSATADPQAVIARIGGEEFLLATTAPACTAESLATQLCTAIAVTPAAVTASIGAVCTRLDGNTAAAGHDVLLEKLVAAADAAMYSAKRAGGNQVHHPDHHPNTEQRSLRGT
ncbi:GGDEF domain-containing protein [Mycolicibacterium pallens]|uniref:GGDEF domain-containing protein n=1 Tax=Mycolicibacterium pallens TaxID=370524 RepID=A0ABX8VVG8_9MYCO|nr:GGDEF domain-containing protein [Mycolicibacterium pallens]QYL20221.1 GGDEF domain-containing protein [Mycolicibacterium pallens]